MEQFQFNYNEKESLNGNSWIIKNPKKIIIIITGMAEHSERYDAFAKYLNSNGFSVYCLDHFGHGKNGKLGCVPPNYFSKEIDIFNSLVLKLKREFNVGIVLFSHSMGSFICQGYLERYSSNIEKAVLCGTNGKNGAVKFGVLFAKIIVHKNNVDKESKFLFNLSVGAYDKPYKNEGKNAWLSVNKENVDAYNKDEFSGFKCSNGFYKEFLKGLNRIQKKKNVSKISKDTKIFIIGGDGDPVGNYSKGLTSLYNLYKKSGLNVGLKIYKNMRHEILNETGKELVYRDILTFIDGNV